MAKGKGTTMVFRGADACRALAALAKPATPDFLKPPASLLCKLASIVGHAEEATGPNGHHFDRIAFESLMGDSEVRCWMTQMRSASLAPLPRATPSRGQHVTIPKDIDDFPGPEDFGVASSPVSGEAKP